MKTIWIATANEHKRQEFEQIFGSNFQIRSLKDLDQPLDIEENGTTFEENALIKARALYQAVHEPVIADDSGLEVDALDKAPGIYSSRWMGEDTPYSIKNRELQRLVEGKDRTARFVCVIAYIDEKGNEKTYRGTMEGEIARTIEGENGFGYDPVFYYPLFKTTSANVPAELKNAHSHRGKAIMLFKKDQNLK